MKRIITMQDISCVGKCSLSVALPIISSFGIEACPLPTALLSCHTAFENFEYFDLSCEAERIIRSLKNNALTFDGIYTGYLGSVKQVSLAEELINEFKTENSIIAVDPVMGDNGKLYSGIDPEMPKRMLPLIKKADIIMPNMTEAGFLLGLNRGLDRDDDIPSRAKELTSLGCDVAVITGIAENGNVGTAVYKRSTDSYFTVMRKRIDGVFHGTGDIFASVLFSSLINSLPLDIAVNKAVDFTVEAMENTACDGNARWYGVNFEPLLSNKK